jgi:hypothetical protein
MNQRVETRPSTRAVMVNHNTSAFAELAIRSWFANNRDYPVDLVVYDNDSSDPGLPALRALTGRLGIPFQASGFSITSPYNSHGEILGRFVLDPVNRHADYLLFLDSDVCFTRPGVLGRLLDSLDADPTVFGAGPVLTWDGETEITPRGSSLYTSRLHPCCALVRNTDLLRDIVTHIGLTAASLIWAEHTEYADTFALTTRAMRTHGLHHVLVDVSIAHAFEISYIGEAEALRGEKEQRRDHWLAQFRALDRPADPSVSSST